MFELLFWIRWGCSSFVWGFFRPASCARAWDCTCCGSASVALSLSRARAQGTDSSSTTTTAHGYLEVGLPCFFSLGVKHGVCVLVVIIVFGVDLGLEGRLGLESVALARVRGEVLREVSCPLFFLERDVVSFFLALVGSCFS